MSDILYFSGAYRWLSNFYPCRILFEDDWYPSTEHAFQAAKTVFREKRIPFMEPSTLSLGQAKREGRKLDIRPDWEQIKIQTMYEICRFKFLQEPFRHQLLATGEGVIEEGNTWGDRFWGKVAGEGRNELGKIIMRIRRELRCQA